MRVYCTDGTVFECRQFDVNEFGLVLYGQRAPEERDRYEDGKPEQSGFVPHERLWYVLPNDVTPGVGAPVPERGHPWGGPTPPVRVDNAGARAETGPR